MGLRIFHNELGNKCVISVTADRREVHIAMTGPDSSMSNLITRHEAEQLVEAVQEALAETDSPALTDENS